MFVSLKYFFKSTAFGIFLGIFFIVSGIILYTLANPNNNFMYGALGYVVRPLEEACGYIDKHIGDFNHQFLEKENLKEENESLKKQISELRDSIVDYHNIKRENLRFKKFYGIKDADSSIKFVSASVVGRDATEVFGDFMIDQGIEAGISVNDAVITENGLVGKICQANKGSSKVRTILSPDIKMAIINSRTNEDGIISGTLDYAKDNATRMIFIPAQNEMKSGDILATSGISGMYPKNLKVGTVGPVEYDSYENSYYARIEPFENIKKVSDVFVITGFKGKGVVDLPEGDSQNQGDK